MSVKLQKGQKVSLTKDNSGLNNIFIGCGWDEAKKGFFGFGKGQDIDVDASVIVLRNGKFVKKSDLVYYGNLNHSSGAINHMGDNLTGEGEGDDEVIQVTLNDLPSDVSDLVVVVNIYQAEKRKQDFGLINNAFIRIVDRNTNQELCKFDMSNGFPGATSVIFGKLYNKGGEWRFNAIGEGTNDGSISELVKRFE